MKIVYFSLLINMIYLGLFYIKCDTQNAELVSKFKIQHIQSGDGKSFPIKARMSTISYNATNPETGIIVDSNESFTFKMAGYRSKCLNEVVSQMSLGERLNFTCPKNMTEKEFKVNKKIPRNIDIIYAVELIVPQVLQPQRKNKQPTLQKDDL